jgi:hypothetical protein
MESIRETQKKYCSMAMAFAIFAGFFFVLAGQSPMGKGLILGTFFSIVNFILIGETIPHNIGKTKGKTFFLSGGSLFIRYALMAIPIIMGVKLEQFNLISVIAGIFMIQMVIFADHALALYLSNREKQA